MILPKLGYDILTSRQRETEEMVVSLLNAEDDLEKLEYFERDPEKIEYAKDPQELRDRWRKILKARMVSRYLDLLEENKNEKKETTTIDKELWAQAREKVFKSIQVLFDRLKQVTLQDYYDLYFSSITRAFDPHSNYMAPDTKEDFDIHMRGSLEGIGAMLREDDGYIKVVRIIPGSASAKQGMLQAEDIILQVGEGDEEPVEITDMRLRDAVRLIRGPKGSEVRLTVRKPDGKTAVIAIIRDVVQIEETFVKGTVLEQDGHKIGYIVIPSFYRDFEGSRNGDAARNSTDDTRAELEKLKAQGIQGLILDLRDNGGGSLVDAVDITGLFLKDGPVVQVKNSFGSKKVLNDEDDDLVWDGPMVVLVNIFSASASEILAAALQDYGRAVIVGGKHTHGKGTVQTIINMNDNVPLLRLQNYNDLGALKVTIQKFYRINGGSTQFEGVVSDIVLPSLYDYFKSGEKYLDYALAWDQVAPISYLPYTGRKLDLEMLRKKSESRIQHEEGLKIIAEEAEKSKQKIEKTSMSLRFSDMQHERQISNESRDKVGEHYKKYQEEQLDEFDSPDDGESSEVSDLQEDARQDPYVNEVVHILLDMGLTDPVAVK